jgi:sugar phosphate isomerase/epimerase
LGCSTGSFPADRWETAIAKVAWAGYQAIELRFPGAALPDADELLRRVRANELDVAALYGGALPADPSAEADLARIGRVCVSARPLDAPLVVLDPPAEGSVTDLARTLHLLDRALSDVPVDLCLTNGRETLLADPDAIGRLWAAGLPRRIGLALDPGEALLAGWSPLDLDALPALPRHVYLTDAAAGRTVPAGEGELELEALGSALRVRGYGGIICLLLQNADAWAVEPMTREIREAAGNWFA